VKRLDPDNIVDFLADIVDRRGGESYLGEAVTMREHMLQAAHLAEQAGAAPELVAGALLHDIGHYTGEFPEDALEQGTDNYHQDAGARALAPFFPRLVVDCVRHHVAAKRYLCAARPGYLSRLSDASLHSLALQGGPMSSKEVAEFEEQADLDALTAVREWDDEAKVPGRAIPPFEHYRPLLQGLVDRVRHRAAR
jgi:predicted HD phosphohydrolase